MLFVLFVCILTIGMTWLVSYKRQELFTLREHLGQPTIILVGFVLIIMFCAVLLCVCKVRHDLLGVLTWIGGYYTLLVSRCYIASPFSKTTAL